jgi:general secretion pathway protein N
MRRERFGHVLLIALCLSAPAFAYTASGVDDTANPGIDNPGLDVTRHAMPPPDVTAKPTETPAVAANPLWAIPLSALTATRTRPLFTPSRRPPAPVVASVPVAAPRPPPAQPPAAPQHPNLTLVGTVAGENEGMAVFIDTTTRDMVRLRTGEGHNGWVLQSVERRAAMLQKGDQTETLALPKPSDASAPAPVVSTLPPPPPPPPQPQQKSAAPAPAPAGAPQSQGCAPEPVGC